MSGSLPAFEPHENFVPPRVVEGRCAWEWGFVGKRLYFGRAAVNGTGDIYVSERN